MKETSRKDAMARRRRRLPFVLAVALFGAQETRADFEKAFAETVVKNCVGCHNTEEAKGGLDLTRKEGLFKGGKSGPAVVAGKPEAGELIERITNGSMPPKKSGLRLSEAEISRLRAWVRAGIDWPAGRVLSPFEFTSDRRAGYDWWSFQPVHNPLVPDVQRKDWPRVVIDRFVLHSLEQRGLDPAPEADRITYLRRAKFDLLGLPPTPDEIDAFVNDAAAYAYEKLIDRLLASPHYGERWGRHWLDVVRFGESDGFENDKLREHAWHYRDYVIRSFNDDKPYPQFVKEQLAGDVLRPITRDGIIATGFLVAGPWDEIQNVTVSPSEKKRTHEEQLEEILAAVGQTFLGLTVNCARCHDHKFDPIPQVDYYRMKAVFDGIDYGNRPLLTPDEQTAREAALAPLRTRVVELKKRIAALALLKISPVVQVETALAELKQSEATLAKDPVPLVYAGVRVQPGPTHVLLRGDLTKPGPQVTAAGLSPVRRPPPDFGLPAAAAEGERRVRFAAWVADADNPLTARVLVNRVWQYHFGRGLVETPSDFGFHGGKPSHPELLDWLTRTFIEDGWSVKRLHRCIMLSATYRQSAQLNAKAATLDADNRLLWRFAPRRLEAEIVRDAMLAVSGELNVQAGGPSFRPFTVTVRNHNFYHLFDKDTPEFNRRTVYRMNVNTGKSPFLDALDCPAPSLTAPRRRGTTTPLQALALMNDTFVVRQAERFAARVRKRAGAAACCQVNTAFRFALGRNPSDAEREAALAAVTAQGLETLCWALLNTSEFLHVR